MLCTGRPLANKVNEGSGRFGLEGIATTSALTKTTDVLSALIVIYFKNAPLQQQRGSTVRCPRSKQKQSTGCNERAAYKKIKHKQMSPTKRMKKLRASVLSLMPDGLGVLPHRGMYVPQSQLAADS